MNPPDVLVLGVGGTLGEAWLSGFLAGAGQEGGIDFRQSAHLVGTSAGSIVAARLAAGLLPRLPADAAGAARQAPLASASPAPAALERLARFPPDESLPAVRAALRAARPGRALARAALLARLPRGRIPLDELRARIAALGPRFDGRLRVVAVDARTGHRVVFGAPGAPDADVPDAVAASCAVPGLFRPVRIGGRDYVDGGVWSPANLDIAPVRPGTHVLCLVPTAALGAGGRIAARVLGHSWQAAIAVEAAAARRRGARVTIIGPDAGSSAAMGVNLMDASRRDQVASAGFAQGIAMAASPAGAHLYRDTDLP
ncbi:MAG: patatin-like phospholipase family protein [Actinobacteria bacterium]|nr:patatin-like phospholipase family protein [Actinomycetota bacterium]